MSMLDESTRPRRPKGTGAPTPAGQVGQRTLVNVHRHLRDELTRIQQAVAQVAAERLPPEQARDLINRTAMRQNEWTLGAFCAAYCRVLSVHHTIEDEALFPSLRRADASLGPVLERLEQEHEIIAEVLDTLDRSLVSLINGHDGIDEVRAVADQLADVLLSHLAYEEEELLDPIGEFSIVV
jgi:hemerythrin-like domain-containing protein